MKLETSPWFITYALFKVLRHRLLRGGWFPSSSTRSYSQSHPGSLQPHLSRLQTRLYCPIPSSSWLPQHHRLHELHHSHQEWNSVLLLLLTLWPLDEQVTLSTPSSPMSLHRIPWWHHHFPTQRWSNVTICLFFYFVFCFASVSTLCLVLHSLPSFAPV